MKKILIIEDDIFISELYTRALTQAGHSVVTAADGEEGLQKTTNQTYDLIILDIMLPKITGLELLRRFRSPDSPLKEVPIFLLTNLGQEEIIRQAFKLGADGYLLKAHLTPSEVVAEIEAFLKGEGAEADKPQA